MALEAVKQPVINGYFIAGSLVGPGGAGLIKVGSRFPALHVCLLRLLLTLLPFIVPLLAIAHAPVPCHTHVPCSRQNAVYIHQSSVSQR